MLMPSSLSSNALLTLSSSFNSDLLENEKETGALFPKLDESVFLGSPSPGADIDGDWN
jgi:hypothetical protein